jgi:anti-sigma-K factor RskA
MPFFRTNFWRFAAAGAAAVAVAAVGVAALARQRPGRDHSA